MCECSRPPRGRRTTLEAMSTQGTKIRFGIVGTGGIANTHATGLAALGDDAALVPSRATHPPSHRRGQDGSASVARRVGDRDVARRAVLPQGRLARPLGY